jgi:hypothetical protein
MINEKNLRDALLSLIADQKSQYVVIASLMAELHALRETVRGLDPTFAEVLEQKRRQYSAENDSTVQSIIAGYGAKFEAVKNGYVC